MVSPNSRLQLWFGLVVSIASCLIYSKLSPYRHELSSALQMASLLQIMFNYISAVCFFYHDPADDDVYHNFWGQTVPREEYVGVLLFLAN